MDWKKRLLAAGIFLALLVFGTVLPAERQAMAAETGPGTLTVRLDDIGTPKGGVGFTAYYVGTLEGNQWKLEESLRETGVDLNAMTYADEWDTAALKLARAAAGTELGRQTGETDGDGAFTMAGLPAGMYLLVQNSGKDTYGTVSPFLTGLPSRDEDGSTRWELTVNPKAEVPPESSGGRIEVTKRMGYLDPELLEVMDLTAEDAVYYVGIFRDKKGTVPYGTDYLREIRIRKASSGKAVFEDLPAGTYYIFETDRAGNPYEVDEVQYEGTVSWVCQIEDGSSQEVTLDGRSEAPAGSVALYNLYYERPDGFSYNAYITIWKTVLENGQETTADGTFYAGVFRDEEGTELQELVELEQNGAVTVEVPLGGEKGDEEITYYIYETDEDGNPVDKNTFAYDVSGEGGVTLTKGRLSGELTLTNTKNVPTVTPTAAPTVTPTTEPGVTPTTPPGASIAPTPGSTGAAAVRTGDDTPVLLYLLAAVCALGAIAGCFCIAKGRKRRKGHE